MIGYTPLPAGQSGGITGTLGVNAWSAPAAGGTKLDVLIAQGAVISRAFSARLLRTGYAGQCCRLRGNGTGSPEADIPFTGGALDKGAAAALKASGGGTMSYWRTWYDQTGNAHAVQSTAANQVRYGEGVFATGAMGDSSAAQTSCWLESSGAISQPFTIWAVCSFAATTPLRNLVGSGASSTVGLTETATTRQFAQNWGTWQGQTSGSPPLGLMNVAGVANGANSTLWLGGVLRGTGNAGTAGLPVGTRIGSGANTAGQNWFGAPNNTIAEVIVFGSDPTGLPGWSDFVADAKTYFGTA